jgi:hypothetical protein
VLEGVGKEGKKEQIALVWHRMAAGTGEGKMLTTRCVIPEGYQLHDCCCENLKS